MNTKSVFLKESGLFKELTENQFDYLELNTRLFHQKKGEYLEENNRNILQLISGKLKVYELDPLGNELVKFILKETDLFGALVEVNGISNHDFGKVITQEAIVASYPKSVIWELLAANASFSEHYAKQIWRRYKLIEDQYRILRRHRDVKNRLIYFLINWGIEDGKKVENYTIVENYLTHEELASLIGTTRVTATNLLNQLKQSGAILYSRNHFCLYMNKLNAEYATQLSSSND